MSTQRKSVYATVSAEVSEAIERLARSRGVKVPELIRQLITQALQPEGPQSGARSVEGPREENVVDGERRGRGVSYLLAQRDGDSRIEYALRNIRAASEREDDRLALDAAHAHLDDVLFAEGASPRRYSRVDATIAARSLPWRTGGAVTARMGLLP